MRNKEIQDKTVESALNAVMEDFENFVDMGGGSFSSEEEMYGDLVLHTHKLRDSLAEDDNDAVLMTLTAIATSALLGICFFTGVDKEEATPKAAPVDEIKELRKSLAEDEAELVVLKSKSDTLMDEAIERL